MNDEDAPRLWSAPSRHHKHERATGMRHQHRQPVMAQARAPREIQHGPLSFNFSSGPKIFSLLRRSRFQADTAAAAPTTSGRQPGLTQAAYPRRPYFQQSLLHLSAAPSTVLERSALFSPGGIDPLMPALFNNSCASRYVFAGSARQNSHKHLTDTHLKFNGLNRNDDEAFHARRDSNNFVLNGGAQDKIVGIQARN